MRPSQFGVIEVHPLHGMSNRKLRASSILPICKAHLATLCAPAGILAIVSSLFIGKGFVDLLTYANPFELPSVHIVSASRRYAHEESRAS